MADAVKDRCKKNEDPVCMPSSRAACASTATLALQPFHISGHLGVLIQPRSDDVTAAVDAVSESSPLCCTLTWPVATAYHPTC